MENNFCEFCWREFGSKSACNIHREMCKKNPNYKIRRPEYKEPSKEELEVTMDIVEKLSNC